jgi:hypothetical protein
MSTTTTPTGHIVGATYFSTYWQERYTVLREDMTYIGTPGITVEWEDGRHTTHCTHVGNDLIIET